jgi:propanol-preferring alcohol dehydrogenase
VKGKDLENIRNKINQATGRREVDVVINVAGTEESIELGASLLAIGGTMICSGLMGTEIKTPLFPLVGREHSIQGSFWGNYNELREVIELAKKGMIRHHIQKYNLSEANDVINRLRDGKVLGRAVLVPESAQDAA